MNDLIKGFLKLLLSKEHRALLDMGMEFFENHASEEQRHKFKMFVEEILKDGKITDDEWRRLGGKEGLNIVKRAG